MKEAIWSCIKENKSCDRSHNTYEKLMMTNGYDDKVKKFQKQYNKLEKEQGNYFDAEKPKVWFLL